MEIRNIIFDFDGTLADTTALIVATIKETVRCLNLPERSVEAYKGTIGLRLDDVPSRLWPNKANISESYASTYRKNFEEIKKIVPIELFSGVRETLNDLKKEGLRMAIATSRGHESLTNLLESFGIADYFDILVGGDDVVKGKPHPEPVVKILTERGWLSAETIVVGDMDVDIMMGRAAGTTTCGVTYGNGKEAELSYAGANFIIHHFSELLKVLRKSCRRRAYSSG